MSRIPDDWTGQDPRDFLEWLLRNLEELADEKRLYESRSGRPWSDESRAELDRVSGYSERLDTLFDMAGAEWAAARVEPFARHVRDYLAGHWSGGREKRPAPVLVFRGREPGEGPAGGDGSGGETPPEGAA